MATLAELAARRCRPLRGPEHRLADAAVKQHLSVLPGWALADDGQSIHKTFRFPDYHRTMAFVNAIAYVAHQQDHHPDLGVHYDRAEVTFSTHDVGGLSENDFTCAARVEALAGEG